MSVQSTEDWVPILIIKSDGEFHVKPIPLENRFEFKIEHEIRIFEMISSGTIVKHSKFGVGQIIGISIAQPGLVSVRFDSLPNRKDAIKINSLKFQNPEDPNYFRGLDF